MAVETLKIVLTADNKQAIAGMNETVNSLNKVSAAGAATGGAVTKMGSNFTGLSRVIQDLPYGFNAIANNLTNILPAAGALGLGISALVAGLQFAQLGFGAWTRGIKLASDATTIYNKVNESFIENVAKERAELDTLYITATNANVPMKARNAAVEQMQSKYGSYLSNMDAESIKAGRAADNYMRIVSALDKKAMAQAGEEVKVEKYKELFKIKEKINALNQEYGVGVKKVLEDTSAGYAKIKTSVGGVAESTQQTADKAEGAAAKLADYTKKLGALGFEARNVQSSIDDLNNLIQDNTVDPLKQPPDAKGGGGGKPKEVAVKDENKALEEQIQIYKRLQQAMMGQGFITQEKAKEKDLIKLKLTMDGNAALNEITAKQLNLEDQKNARTEQANKLTDRAMQGLTGIANAMANGGNIGEAFGNMFKQLAIDIAMAAAKAAIFQGILSLLPVGGFAASSSGFIRGFGKLLGFSEGGTVSGPTSGYPVMLHGTEHIVRPDQMKSIIASASQMGGSGASRVVVEGRIQGQDIWLSQQRTNTFRGLTN